ncbi:hypothetical protein VTK73DRAFT_1566 [Phialemonium thermophilum]|uniref:Uncharacterized protein n=1 Tax=Phialemonium thermophilum TaxID=223376 RepID=A0ABR3VTA0_9PEZI
MSSSSSSSSPASSSPSSTSRLIFRDTLPVLPHSYIVRSSCDIYIEFVLIPTRFLLPLVHQTTHLPQHRPHRRLPLHLLPHLHPPLLHVPASQGLHLPLASRPFASPHYRRERPLPRAPRQPLPPPLPQPRHDQVALDRAVPQLCRHQDPQHEHQREPPRRLPAERRREPVSDRVRGHHVGVDRRQEPVPRPPSRGGDGVRHEHDGRLVVSVEDPVDSISQRRLK